MAVEKEWFEVTDNELIQCSTFSIDNTFTTLRSVVLTKDVFIEMYNKWIKNVDPREEWDDDLSKLDIDSEVY